MAMERGGIIVGPDGSVRVEAGSEADSLGKRAGRYEFVPSPPGLLMLQRQAGASGEDEARLLVTGQILDATTVMEILGIIANNAWRGELVVVDGAAERRLSFERAALKSAFSAVPNERLGEVMVSVGAISVDQLAQCVLGASRHRRFGEIAMDHGFITKEVLFDMLKRQMERIFHNTLLVASGHYWFIAAGDDDDTAEMTLHLPVTQLLMESVQRMDEMAEYRSRVPSGELCPVLTDKASRMSMGDSMRPVALMCDGSRSIVEIARAMRVDEFDVTRVVSQLLQLGCVDLKEQEIFDLRAIEYLLDRLNETMEMITETADRHGAGAEVRETVQSWMSDTRLMNFFGNALDSRGAVPVQASIDRLEQMQLERPIESLRQALHDLVSFALFSASTSVPRPVASTLTKRVNRRLSKLTQDLKEAGG